MASGATLLILTPQSSSPPVTLFATLDTVPATTATPDISAPVVDFDDVVDEYMDWPAVMPRNYDGGGITLTYVYTCEATTNVVSWACQIRREADGANHLTKDFAAAVVASQDTVEGTARNFNYKTLAMLNSEIDGVLVGESFTLRVFRDVSAGTPAAADAELHRIEVRET